MKKYFIILSLLCISVITYANADMDAEYKQALKEYKENNFTASYEKFSKLEW
jgi:hypothetical protein